MKFSNSIQLKVMKRGKWSSIGWINITTRTNISPY